MELKANGGVAAIAGRLSGAGIDELVAERGGLKIRGGGVAPTSITSRDYPCVTVSSMNGGSSGRQGRGLGGGHKPAVLSREGAREGVYLRRALKDFLEERFGKVIHVGASAESFTHTSPLQVRVF